MNLLFMIPYVPTLVRVRSYQMIRHLKNRGHRITLVTLWVNDQERQELDTFSEYCDEVIASHLTTTQSFANCLWALPTSMPLQAVYSWDAALWNRMKQRIMDRNSAHPIDAVHVEHLRGSQYGVRLSEAARNNKQRLPPIIWDSVDCISHLFKQASEKSRQGLKRRIVKFDLERTARREGWLTTHFKQVLVTSNNDKAALSRLATPSGEVPNIEVVPNGVDLEYFRPGNFDQREKATLVVSGKMSYHANVSMVSYLVREVMPLVWNLRPDVKLAIVGKDPVPEILDMAANPAITITGTVPSLLPYLQNATAAVAPIQYGAGIQNKVLEAMACATPVIATSIATSALGVEDGKNVLVANTPLDWATRIVELIDSPDKQKKLGEAGYEYVQRNHLWPTIASRLEKIYTVKHNDHNNY